GRIVAEAFGGRFDAQPPPNNWKFELPAGLSLKDMYRVMQDTLGAGYLENINLGDHGIKGVLFGSSWQINYKGNWYHFIFLDGEVWDLELVEFHYEKFKPNSVAHFQDYGDTGGKTNGDLPCPK